jgi:hypothetical protein
MVSRGVGVVLCAAIAGFGADQATPANPVPAAIGVGPRYHPPAASARVLQGRPLGALRCTKTRGRFGVHIELFARGRVVIVPAGIGVAAPRARVGAYVRPLGCSYPARTLEPTGVVEVRRGAQLTLRDLFAVWGKPLSRTRLVGFSARPSDPVRAYVAGKRWHGDPGSILLSRHGQIVLELGRYIPPHRFFLFRKGT